MPKLADGDIRFLSSAQRWIAVRVQNPENNRSSDPICERVAELFSTVLSFSDDF